jgi:membrane associated rhomboid family serine protease
VFGLMGAAMVLMRRRGINPWRTSIGTLVLLNLVLTFVISNVSIGGHLGGFLGGALAAWTIADVRPDAGGAVTSRPWLVAGALTAVAWFAAVAGLEARIPFIS